MVSGSKGQKSEACLLAKYLLTPTSMDSGDKTCESNMIK